MAESMAEYNRQNTGPARESAGGSAAALVGGVSEAHSLGGPGTLENSGPLHALQRGSTQTTDFANA